MFVENGRRIPRTEQEEAFIQAAKGSGDVWGQFLRSGRVELELGSEAWLDELQEAYKAWCHQKGEPYIDPYMNMGQLVGWNNVVTGVDQRTKVVGLRLNLAASASGFGALLQNKGN